MFPHLAPLGTLWTQTQQITHRVPQSLTPACRGRGQGHMACGEPRTPAGGLGQGSVVRLAWARPRGWWQGREWDGVEVLTVETQTFRQLGFWGVPRTGPLFVRPVASHLNSRDLSPRAQGRWRGFS